MGRKKSNQTKFSIYFACEQLRDCVLDTEAKLFKKSKAMIVGRPLLISAQPFTGTFDNAICTGVLILISGETWWKLDIW